MASRKGPLKCPCGSTNIEEGICQDCGEAPRKRKKPTEVGPRVLKYLRDRGWEVARVEQNIPGTFHKRDMFGFADYIAVNGYDILAVQATATASNIVHRRKKIMDEPRAALFAASGGLVCILGLKKVREKGTKRMIWVVELENLTVALRKKYEESKCSH